MRRSKTTKIDELISQILKESNLDSRLKEVDLINSWEKIIGKNVARTTTNIYIRNRILYVHLRSSIVRNELLMVRDGLKNALNREVNAKIIDNIIFR